MARIVSVFELDKHQFQRRQVPLEIDNLKMVVQFSDKCVDCEKLCGIKQKDLEHFTHKFNTLSSTEVTRALMVSGRDILSMLTHMVPCVGCRKSVERLFSQLQKSQHPALDPLIITARGEMSLRQEYLVNPRLLFSLFHLNGSKMHSVVEAMTKGKKNKRCNLHSLETHKSKTVGCWLDAWDALSESCREKILVVDMSQLLTTVDTYLDKHKFCTECKSKVMLAYNILVGEQDSSSEKGYCAALYENLRCCAQERHVHVLNDTEFIANLFEKAEPEFIGGKRDRHAKTLDIAQEEILTCLGIHIFERLHRIWQKLRCEEQTWLILFYMGVDTLRKSYQTALEEKQGASNLELLCEELQEKEKKQEVRKELKRQKKRQKKVKPQVCNSDSSSSCSDLVTAEAPCRCPKLESGHTLHNNRGRHHQHQQQQHASQPQSVRSPCSDANFNSLTLSLQSCDLNLNGCPGWSRDPGENGWLSVADVDSCESCSLHGSNEGSGSECSCSCADSVESCECDLLRKSVTRKNHNQLNLLSTCNHGHHAKHAFQTGAQPTLQELLDELCWVDGDEEDAVISEEEILAFKARQVEVQSKRQELRENLRQRFEELHLSKHTGTV